MISVYLLLDFPSEPTAFCCPCLGIYQAMARNYCGWAQAFLYFPKSIEQSAQKSA